MRPRLLRAVLAAAVLLAFAAPASALAEFFAGEPIDGPSADITSLGDVDVARDGSGALAYVRKDGGVDHIFVSRLVNGVWQPVERVDGGLDAASSQPVVAASDGGRIAIAFISGGQLFAVVRPAGASAFTTPALVAGGAANPAIDMSIQGVAYTSFTVAGDVRVARLDRNATSFGVLADTLDVDAAQNAGDGVKRSRVAVSADGTAVVAWGEDGSDGRRHVYARRVFGDRISTAPQDLTLGELDGHAGGNADTPDIDIEDDSSFAWVVFRQAFDDNHTHAIARRLVGSAFEAPVVVDPLGFPATEDALTPRIDLNGRGDGIATSAGSTTFGAFAAALQDDSFGAVQRLDSGNSIAALPVGAVAETGDGVAAWQQRAGLLDAASIHARFFDGRPSRRAAPEPGPDIVVSNADLGATDAALGLDVASNRAGDVVIAFVQGTGAGRQIVVASYDRPPGAFRGYTTTKVRPFARPLLSWGPAFDLWGPITYTVEIDGQPVGQTTDTKLAPLNPVRDGLHRWRVVAVDRRNQTATSPTRLMRIDATPPRLSVKIGGKRKRGALVKVLARAADVLKPGASGVRYVRIRFGDGSPTVTARRAFHSYPHSGHYTIRVSATDKAGGSTVVTRRITIRK